MARTLCAEIERWALGATLGFGSVLLGATLGGCRKSEPAPSQAAANPPSVAAAPATQPAGERSRLAPRRTKPASLEAAGGGAGADVAGSQVVGAPTEQFAPLIARLQGAVALGAPVPLDMLQHALPPEVAEYKAAGEASASKERVGDGTRQTSVVSRRYERAGEGLRLELVDTAQAAFMRSGFAAAFADQEATDALVRRPVALAGYPARLTWQKGSERSELQIMVAERFLVTVRIDATTDPESAVRVAGALDLKKIAQLASAATGEGENHAPAPPNPAS